MSIKSIRYNLIKNQVYIFPTLVIDYLANQKSDQICLQNNKPLHINRLHK